MRKSLLILSALLLTGGGLSAQSHGRHALKENSAKAETELRESRNSKESAHREQWKAHMEMMKKHSGEKQPLFKNDGAKDPIPTTPWLQVIPSGPIAFNLDDCNETQTIPVAIKNVSSEPVSASLFNENATVEVGKKVVDGYELFSMIEVDGSIYAIDYNMEGVPMKLNAETLEVEGISPLYYCYAMAYDGTNLWISGYEGISAYDTDFRPTGARLETGFNNSSSLVFTGEYFIAVDLSWGSGPSQVITFDLEGNKLAQYTLPFPAGMGFAYNAETDVLWVQAAEFPAIYGFRLGDNSNLTMVGYQQFDSNGILSGIVDGKAYLALYSGRATYEVELGSLSRSFSFSQTEIDLQPGQVATINITANSSQGSVSETFDAHR